MSGKTKYEETSNAREFETLSFILHTILEFMAIHEKAFLAYSELHTLPS